MASPPATRRLSDELFHASNLGSTERFTNAAPAGKSLARIDAPGDHAQGWVVTLSAPLGDARDAYARLQWGNGGTRSTADVDWRHGLVLTVWGSFVDVIAVVPSAPVGEPLTLGAHITPGEAHGAIAPTRSRTFQLEPPPAMLRRDELGDDLPYPIPPHAPPWEAELGHIHLSSIPPFAGRLRALGTSMQNGSGEWVIQFRRGPNAAELVAELAGNTLMQPLAGSVPIPPTAQAAMVRNRGQTPLLVQLIYTLSL